MISTPRFVLLWVAVSLPLPLAQRLLFEPASPKTRDPLIALGATVVVLLGTSWLQGRLLARHRRTVRFWVAAALAGWVLAELTQFSLTLQVLRSGSGVQAEGMLRAYLLVATSTFALCFAAPRAVALWGFHRLNAWILWLSGHLVLSLGLLLLNHVLGTLGPLPDPAGFALSILYLSVSAAGTAWMLDLLAFRQAAAASEQDVDA